jgi:hypothetical protein
MKRIEARADWHDWKLVLSALGVGRAGAMREAKTDKATGSRYCAAYSKFLRVHGFDRIDKADRKHCLECLDHFDEIDAWRSSLPPEKQLKWHYPPTVLKHWKRAIKPTDETDETDETDKITEPMVAEWLAQATPEAKQRIRRQLAADVTEPQVRDLLGRFPDATRIELERHSENVVLDRLAAAGKPEHKLTKLLTKAVLSAKSARDPNSSEAMRNANVEELLTSLICLDDTVRKSGLPFQNLSVRLAKSKKR